MSAELSATVAVCRTMPNGMSAGTMARCVLGAAPPEVGPAQKVFAGLFGRLSVSAIVPFVEIGDPPTAVETRAAAPVSVMAMDVTVPVPAGRSAATAALNVGSAGPPDVGPA